MKVMLFMSPLQPRCRPFKAVQRHGGPGAFGSLKIRSWECWFVRSSLSRSEGAVAVSVAFQFVNAIPCLMQVISGCLVFLPARPNKQQHESE